MATGFGGGCWRIGGLEIMRNVVFSVLLIALAVALVACGRPSAQGLVGLWQAEAEQGGSPGHANVMQSSQTVEFLKDGSFKMSSSFVMDGKRQTHDFFTGAYTLIDSNHVRLEIASNVPNSTNSLSLTVTFSLAGNRLEMSKLTSSVVTETTKYRRVK
jgi:hypothetical protein